MNITDKTKAFNNYENQTLKQTDGSSRPNTKLKETHDQNKN